MFYLLEKRSDEKTPIKIKLDSTEVILGSENFTALKSYSKISKSHARLQFHNGSWYIEDLGSRYGVFLDYKRIGRIPVKVKDFSLIGLGGDCISDNVFICLIYTTKKINLKTDCSYKEVSENVSKKTHSNHSGEKRSKFSETSGSYDPKRNELNKAFSQSNKSVCTNSSNSSESSWKIGNYFRSIERSPDQNSFYMKDESPNEHFHDGDGNDDVQSTSSSIEIMDKIMYPSEWVISQISQTSTNKSSKTQSSSKKKGEKYDNSYHTTSSVESLDIIMYPSESVLLEIQKSKEKMKRSADSDNEQLHSSTKFVKLSKVKSKTKNKSNHKTRFISKHVHHMQLSYQKNVQQNCPTDKFASKKYEKVKLKCDTSKTGKDALQSSLKNVKKKKSKKSLKEYKIPRLSSKKHTKLTRTSKSNAEVNVSVVENSDTIQSRPSSTSTKQPTVKKRFDDCGSCMKSLSQDVRNDPTVKNVKRTKTTNSVVSQVSCESLNEDEIIQTGSSHLFSNKYTKNCEKNSQKVFDSLRSMSPEAKFIRYSESLSNTQVPLSIKSSIKSRSSFAESANTKNENNCYYELIKKIVEMNPKWLYEKEKNEVPPSPITNDVVQLPLSFDSHNTYVNSFLQMILLEVWNTVCSMSEPYLKSTGEKKFYFSVLSYQYENGLMKLKCESIVSKDKSFSPNEKSLVILDLKEKNKDGTCRPTFGLITNPKHLEIEFMGSWNCLHKELLQNAQVYKFDVYVKSRGITIATKCSMVGNGICNLEDKINLTHALSSLRLSPMADCILCPDWTIFSVKCPDVTHKNDYLTIQTDICNAVYNEMILPVEKKKIILLEGPPGSGKTEVIVRVCQELIDNAPNTFKILVTAPSHFAVDNIATQMIEFNQRFGSENISFIRTGDKYFIDPELLKHSLHEKLNNAWKKIDLEKEKICTEISKYRKMSFEGSKKYEKEIAQLELKLKDIKWDEMTERYTILDKANIVLSTFYDCLDLYRTKINFSCCIFDEANQATEPDALFPFMFKNSKFFILGDTNQLPPIIKSEIGIKYGFQRSILERFQTYFINKYRKSPAIQLRKQFRMHGDISMFPLRTFYFHDYSPPTYTYSFFNKFELKPYIILDDKSMNFQLDSTNDKTLCSFITSLCSFIKEYQRLSNIAIIVPSEKNFYISALSEWSNIKVCTVDSIQGQEKSICILSCYQGSMSREAFKKHFSCKKRMNVALTRASHCLIICGPMHLLGELPYWKDLLRDSNTRNCYIPYSHSDDNTHFFKKHLLKN